MSVTFYLLIEFKKMSMIHPSVRDMTSHRSENMFAGNKECNSAEHVPWK